MQRFIATNQRRRSASRFGVSLFIAIGWVLGAATIARAAFNQPGNILITDQFNNRVIEIDLAGNIVWPFGPGPGDTSANAIVGTNDAEPGGEPTLMSGTGIPPRPP